jgi:hypothetical protein
MDHGTTEAAADKNLNQVLRIDEAKIQDHLGQLPALPKRYGHYRRYY